MTAPPTSLRSHPDRAGATLANLAAARASAGPGPWAAPGAGSADARIDLKLLQWRALQACERSAAARARLADFDRAQRPDLWAGTVQDGVARGFAVALEEAIALAPADVPALPATDPVLTQTFVGKELRKKKDLLVASGGSRVRFSRKEGLLFVDRGSEQHSANCLRFEARTDRGDLDGFVGDDAERPRLFSAQFLQPVRYTTAPGRTELQLAGRLGRGANGFPLQLTIVGDQEATALELRFTIEQRHRDVRLRARFLGIDPAAIEHECTDVREVVANDAGGFIAFTLVRAVGTLRVDDRVVATPAAQCHGVIQHVFRLGAR